MDRTYDLIVVGLGTAGSIAAIVAGKRGLKTLGIERFSKMGGTATVGGITGYYFGSTGGIYEKVDEIADNNTVFASRSLTKAYALERTAIDNGVEILYNTTVVGVYSDDGTVKGVRLMGDKSFDAYAKYIIDATGDGSVCAMLGCNYRLGRELDGKTQPYTRIQINCSDGRTYCSANRDFGRVDPTDCQKVSRALLHSGASFLCEDYRETGCNGVVLSPMLGIREGRLIECEQTLRLDKLFEGEFYKNPVFYAYADLDKHGWDLAFEDDTLCDWAVAANLGAVNVTVPVPMGAMIPKNYRGIMAVGRCLGADHNLSSTVRMQRDMQKAGEAAAEAICLAVRNNVDVREIEYDQLKSVLCSSGCLSEDNNIGYKFDGRGTEPKVINWLEDMEQIKEQLSTDCPGVAIWSCRLMGNTTVEPLSKWLKSDNQNLKKHSAIALGLLGSNSGLGVLEDMIHMRDDFMLKDCRKHNQLRGVIAIYLMRRLRNVGIVDELISIVTSDSEIEKPIYKKNRSTTRYDIPDYNDIYFQFFTHSIRTLMTLGDSFPNSYNKISTSLEQAVRDENFIKRIACGRANWNEQHMAKNVANVVNDWFMSK